MIFRQQVREYVRGAPISNPHPAIVMFSTCESMKWAHLPNAGGINDQHPILLRYFQIIFMERNEFQIEEDKRRERESKQRGSGRVAGRR